MAFYGTNANLQAGSVNATNWARISTNQLISSNAASSSGQGYAITNSGGIVSMTPIPPTPSGSAPVAGTNIVVSGSTVSLAAAVETNNDVNARTNLGGILQTNASITQTNAGTGTVISGGNVVTTGSYTGNGGGITNTPSLCLMGDVNYSFTGGAGYAFYLNGYCSGGTTTFSRQEQVFPRTGLLTNLYITSCAAAPASGTNIVGVIFTNAPGATPVATSITCTITGNGSTYAACDTTHGVIVTAGELGCIVFTNTYSYGPYLAYSVVLQ